MKNWNKITAKKDSSIIEVMKKIDKSASKFAMIVDNLGKLIGTLSDGDIRRGLLKGIQITDVAEKVMNSSPIFLRQGFSKEEIMGIMRDRKIAHVPILDKEGYIVSVETLEELITPVHKENHVVLMAGGLGSRLGSLTDEIPKPMLKVGSRPILHTIIENFKEYGFTNFHLSVNYKSNVIEEYFGDGKKFGVNIHYIRETTKLGTAGSLSLYEVSNDLPIIVMNGDLLTKINFEKLLEEHSLRKNVATMCVRQYEHQVPYGVILTEAEKMTGIVEKPKQSCFVNGGIYVIDPSVLKLIPSDVYFDMPNFFQKMIDHQLNVGIFPIHEYWLDIGRKDDYLKAHEDFDGYFK